MLNLRMNSDMFEQYFGTPKPLRAEDCVDSLSERQFGKVGHHGSL